MNVDDGPRVEDCLNFGQEGGEFVELEEVC